MQDGAEVGSRGVRARVMAIIAEQAMLDTDELSEGSTLEEIGIDSLGVVESIFAIEEAFDVQVPFNANEPQASEFDVSSVGAIVAAVERLVAERG